MDDYWELKFDWLMSYDVYMGDNIEATRLILRGCKEAVISEGLVFLRVGFYGNLVVIWKYCLFGAPYKL